MKKSLKKWRDRSNATKDIRKQHQIAYLNYYQKLGRKCFRIWKQNNFVQKKFVNTIARISKTSQDYSKLYAFMQIRHFGESRIARKSERKIHAAGDLAYLLQKAYKNTLKTSLAQVQMIGVHLQEERRLLTRVVKRLHSRKLEEGFSKWKSCYTTQIIVEKVNTEGDIAVEALKANRRVEIMKDFLQQHGYTREEINQEVEQRKQKTKSIMKSFIIRLFFKTSKFSVLPKAFNQLKAWRRTRQLYRNAFDTCSKYKNSEIFWAFKRWKHHHSDQLKRLDKLPKDYLIWKCIKDEQLLGSLKCEQGRNAYHINIQLEQRDQLLKGFSIAQRIAFRRMEYKLKWKPIRKAFEQWKVNADNAKLQEADEQVRKTQDIIEELLKICKEAEKRNKDLASENEELRQASLDGIEIAKAVQDLTREREILSDELNAKNLAIKELMQDNNTMSDQLAKF